ncbi:MAG: hypothetical protein H6948_18435 [Zoogloeaceae bacterium]|nr:hypothetical protein [Zoogloeaceae bacterium]
MAKQIDFVFMLLVSSLIFLVQALPVRLPGRASAAWVISDGALAGRSQARRAAR